MNIEVVHDDDEGIFYAETQGLRSTLEYSRNDHSRVLVFYSTFVPIELRGKHIGQALVKAALSYALEHHYKVQPTCPFVRKVIYQFPKYERLIVS